MVFGKLFVSLWAVYTEFLRFLILLLILGTPIYYGGIPYAATTLPAIPSNPRYAVPSQLQTIGVPQIGAAGVPLGIPGATTGMTGAQGRGVSIRGRNRGVVRGAATRSVLNLGRGYAAASEVSMIGGDLQVCN